MQNNNNQKFKGFQKFINKLDEIKTKESNYNFIQYKKSKTFPTFISGNSSIQITKILINIIEYCKNNNFKYQGFEYILDNTQNYNFKDIHRIIKYITNLFKGSFNNLNNQKYLKHSQLNTIEFDQNRESEKQLITPTNPDRLLKFEIKKFICSAEYRNLIKDIKENYKIEKIIKTTTDLEFEALEESIYSESLTSQTSKIFYPDYENHYLFNYIKDNIISNQDIESLNKVTKIDLKLNQVISQYVINIEKCTTKLEKNQKELKELNQEMSQFEKFDNLSRWTILNRKITRVKPMIDQGLDLLVVLKNRLFVLKIKNNRHKNINQIIRNIQIEVDEIYYDFVLDYQDKILEKHPDYLYYEFKDINNLIDKDSYKKNGILEKIGFKFETHNHYLKYKKVRQKNFPNAKEFEEKLSLHKKGGFSFLTGYQTYRMFNGIYNGLKIIIQKESLTHFSQLKKSRLAKFGNICRKSIYNHLDFVELVFNYMVDSKRKRIAKTLTKFLDKVIGKKNKISVSTYESMFVRFNCFKQNFSHWINQYYKKRETFPAFNQLLLE